MRASFVIPCYNSSGTLRRTLQSVLVPTITWSEVVVVDDGSNDPLEPLVRSWGLDAEQARVITMPANRGKPAACNAGFAATTGDIVVVLDADDEMVCGWPDALIRLFAIWPTHSPLAFAGTSLPSMEATGLASGLISREEWLAGKYRGEYLPVFRGATARSIGYVEVGTRRICGKLSYARILERGPLFFFPEIVRVYHSDTPGSISKNFLDRGKALDSYKCFHAARVAIEGHDLKHAKNSGAYLPGLVLREAVYMAFGLSRVAAMAFSVRRFGAMGITRTLSALLISLAPRFLLRTLVELGKRLRLLSRFG